MFKIDYKLSSGFETNIAKFDLATVDCMDLRYDLFPGDITLKDDKCDLSANWGWIPIVDFAAGLNIVVEDLLQGEKELAFDFTESDSMILFKVSSEKQVLITCTYAPGEIQVSLQQLKEEAEAFAKRLGKDLLAVHPQLAKNKTFTDLLSLS